MCLTGPHNARIKIPRHLNAGLDSHCYGHRGSHATLLPQIMHAETAPMYPLVPATGTDAATPDTYEPQPGGRTSSGPSAEGIALEDLLLWLTAYRDIFSRPCCVTG